MITREIKETLMEYARSFRAVLVVGPRQSGKTTLVKQCFTEKPYVSLENPDQRELATEDPKAFLNRFPQGAILDEVQRAPLLFNYLQEILDNSNDDGLFILTGSNNILLQENVTQSLAGRIGILDLLPLSYREISQFPSSLTLSDIIPRGFYPEIYDKHRKPQLWYPSYIRTYVERDVQQIKQIENGLLFQKFLKLCAGRIGQQVNIASLSNDCGIDIRTVQSWLSVLQSTYIIYLLQPFHQNFNKRIVKSPKLYFYDTGLSCSLLNIKTSDEFLLTHFKGALVENFFVTECIKNNQNNQQGEQFYYWRDNNGVEVDLIVEKQNKILPIEIKAAQTYTKDFSKNLKKFKSYSGINEGCIVYDGTTEFKGSNGIEVLHWSNYLKRDN
ncbi:MAG: ATP-binding protein [Chitinophagales bacterium]